MLKEIFGGGHIWCFQNLIDLGVTFDMISDILIKFGQIKQSTKEQAFKSVCEELLAGWFSFP